MQTKGLGKCLEKKRRGSVILIRKGRSDKHDLKRREKSFWFLGGKREVSGERLTNI